MGASSCGERTCATRPRSRGSTIRRTLATVWSARPAPSRATSSSSRRQPVAAPPRPSASRRSSGARSRGGAIGPQPRFSFVPNFSFLKRVTRLATITSPCDRRPPVAGALGEDVERLERDRAVGLGVVVDVDAADVGLALVPVEPVDVVLDRLVEVDRVARGRASGPRRGRPRRCTRGRSGVVSMITTFSGAAVRSEISEAGKFSSDQYQRPSSPWRTWPSSARKASRSSAAPGPKTSPGANGSSNVGRLAGGRAGRGGCPGRSGPPRAAGRGGTPGGGRRTGRPGAAEATRTATLVSRRRPARPICCQVAAMEPG